MVNKAQHLTDVGVWKHSSTYELLLGGGERSVSRHRPLYPKRRVQSLDMGLEGTTDTFLSFFDRGLAVLSGTFLYVLLSVQDSSFLQCDVLVYTQEFRLLIQPRSKMTKKKSSPAE